MNKHFFRKAINPLLLVSYSLRGIRVHDNFLSSSLEVKRALLYSLSQKSKCSILIETGTYVGDAIAYLESAFEKVYSIELGQELFEKAQIRFRSNQKITIIHGDSAVELPKLLATITKPAFFWLDGHFSFNEQTVKSNKVTPIIQEMTVILNSAYNHFIAIDDARLFVGTHNYPTIHTLYSLIKKLRPDYSMHIINDVIIVCDKNITIS